ncbi:glycosyl transferase [Pseudodesulfovibrio sediminis]|uniref:Glycosyl transferase n=2 Tax=Pseudodesulfovibrio sediminis TaxID=2810563 RepID=A0ABM7P803_9BACT|nr:glycosyl transferase [Pseudodesulfovibrio sediminis]
MNMTHNRPKISVVTGYYKRAGVVERTLQSLLDQTFEDFEIIVFDDASPDGTAEAIREFVEKANDPRLIPVYHKNNMGFVNGLIDAVSRARGEYIAIQGSGDVSWPTRLEQQSHVLDHRPGTGVVGCHYQNVIEAKGIHRLRTPNADHTTLEELIQTNVFSHGEVMFRKVFYDAVGGYRPQFEFCQDYDLWLRMIKVCRFETVKDLLYTRYVDFDGVSYKPEKFLAQTQFSVLAKKLALSSKRQQAEILERTSRLTLFEQVPLTNAALQKKVVHATLRAVVWGNYMLARDLVMNLVVCRRMKAFLTGTIFFVEKAPILHRVLMMATGSSSKKQEV